MIIKKIVSTILCILAISPVTTMPTSAVRSANCSNIQIDTQVQLFNKTKLKKLNWYILCVSFDYVVTRDLMTLYKKLYNLNELNETSNDGCNSNSIGSQLDNIFYFMDIISEKYYTKECNKSDFDNLKSYFAANLNTKVRNLITRIDQVNSL